MHTSPAISWDFIITPVLAAAIDALAQLVTDQAARELPGESIVVVRLI
jgi:hypothetical protein